RDPQGRITAVADPMGNRVSYQYDGQGDLVAVKDPMNNTTQFVYRADRPHYLDRVLDPMGRMGTRSEYDDEGRLVSLVNGTGDPVDFASSPADLTETILDALGNPTTFQYDDRGNILAEVNPLGQITRRTYDANNNMLTEADPLGHTTE